jgi:NitT/TauT family transport system substrate-binding protein
LKFGSVQSISDAGVYVAIDKGYFKEQGINHKVVAFRKVTELIAPIGTGELDITALPLSSALLAAADRGVELKLVADKGQSLPGWEFAWIVLRKDLADSGKVKKPADLKGMKIAIPSKGSLGDMTVQMMLAEAGLKPGDADVEVLAFPAQAAAFGNKAIAAAYSIDPFIARGVQKGFSVKWIPNSKYFGGKTQTAVIIFGPKVAKNRDLARRWMIAYIKGIRTYLDAIEKKAGRDEVVKILTKYTRVKDPKLYDVMEMPYLDPNGLPDKKSMDAQYKWFVDNGVYKGKRTFDDILDLSFVEYALKKLGKR